MRFHRLYKSPGMIHRHIRQDAMAQIGDMMMASESVEHGAHFPADQVYRRQQFSGIEISLQDDPRPGQLPGHLRPDTPVDAEPMSPRSGHRFQRMPSPFGEYDHQRFLLHRGHDLA